MTGDPTVGRLAPPATVEIPAEELADVAAELLSLSRSLAALNDGSDTSLSSQLRELARRLLSAAAPHHDRRFDGEPDPRSPVTVEAYARSCEKPSLAQLALEGPNVSDAAVIRSRREAFAAI